MGLNVFTLAKEGKMGYHAGACRTTTNGPHSSDGTFFLIFDIPYPEYRS